MSVAISAAVISIISVAYSYVSNKRAQKKAKEAQEAAKENARGMYVPLEGEIMNAPLYYGRTKVAGARVFHRIQNDYIYTPPVGDEITFVSKGDLRRLNTRLPSIIVSKVTYSYYLIPSGIVLITGQPTYSISYDVTNNYWDENSMHKYQDLIEGNTVISGILLYSVDGNYQLVADGTHPGVVGTLELGSPHLTIGTPGAMIRLTHPAWYRDLDGNIVNSLTEANYEVVSYADGVLNLKGPNFNDVNAPTSEVAAMSANASADKNRLLVFKQVLGIEGISDIHHILLDDQDFKNDTFNTRVVINPTGGSPGSLFLANCSDQTNSKFPGYAHATCVIWIDRDEPQFGGVPDLVFLLEGLKVRSIEYNGTTFVLSTQRIASNNFVYVLLDYLLNPVYGKGLSVAAIDLESFYWAAINCGRYVPINGSFDIPITGVLWQEKARKGSTRRIMLGEYNGSIDTGKSVRDNVEQMMKVLYDADLIWSSGKYRLLFTYPEEYKAVFDDLSLGKIGGDLPTPGQPAYYNAGEIVQYPPGPAQHVDLYMSVVDNNTNPPLIDGVLASGWISGPHQSLVCAYVTDDDIIADEVITQVWTPTQDRLNHCTVRFFNESKEFAEDSVSWPSKYNRTTVRGTNGRTYTFSTHKWTGNQFNELLTSYGVWDGSDSTLEAISWKFYCQVTGVYVLRFAVDDSGTISIVGDGVTIIVGDSVNASLNAQMDGGYSQLPAEVTVTLTKGIIYTITANAVDSGGAKAVGGQLFEASTNKTWWTTRDIAYDDIWIEEEDNDVYMTYFTEDGEAILETEDFVEGISNEWHAKAYAEYKVRSSRNSSRISLALSRKFINLEPGDIIKVNSDVLQIPGELYKIDEFKVNENSNISVTCSKFDARNLAWNAKDDELVEQRNIYRLRIGQARNLIYTADCLSPDYAGRLEWDAAEDASVNSYVIYRTPCLITAITPETLWINVGETSETYFNPPRAAVRNWTYAVVSKVAYGGLAVQYDLETGASWPMVEARGVSMISLPQPESPMVYCTPDSTGAINRLRVNMTFEQAPGDDFNGVFMLAAYSDRPNRFRISGIVNDKMYIESFSLAPGMTTTMPVGASSTSRRVVVSAAGTIVPTTNFGEWWAQLVRGTTVVGYWKNVTGMDASAVYFDIPFEVTPQEGDILEFAATTWEDNRIGDFKLGVVSSGNAYEIIRWETMTHDGTNTWLTIIERGAEGTDVLSDVIGKDFWYYPAPGDGTAMLKVDKALFTQGADGSLSAEGELSISIPSGNSISLAAGVFFEENGIVKERSNIVPAIYGGEI